MNRKEIRYELAREMARYLLLHLQEELKKPPGVSDYIAIEGVSFRKITEGMIDTLRKEFPDISQNSPLFQFVQTLVDCNPRRAQFEWKPKLIL
jgi:hypothetical protein